MVFCAYCGQSFKRKEHLERHLPTHTNVKPYKCDSCQLSFARRDLLQKHHSTYHEPQDPSKRSNGDPPANSRTPIACMNCATAKAGCDKKVPCSRCADKNLPCAPRFARRSAKGTFRTISTSKVAQPPQPNGHSGRSSQERDGVAEIHAGNSKEGSIKTSHSQPDLLMWGGSNDQCVDTVQGIQFSPMPFDELGKHQEGYSGVETLLGGNGDFDSKGVDMDALNMWTNCSMDIDLCANNGLDFPSQIPMQGLWYQESPDSLIQALPSPPSTTSTAHSRINSISPTWQLQNESHLQEPPGLFPESSRTIPELDSVIASEEAWPLAKCNPRMFSGNCPRTAIVHLETLQNCSKLGESWNSMNDLMVPFEKSATSSSPTIVPLLTTTRDKIIAFAQGFLMKALLTHRSGPNTAGNGNYPPQSNFFTLPPSNVLENLLRCSVKSLSPYFSLINGSTLDPNEMLLDNDSSTLLFLLMMAQGASTLPKAEARYLAAGLTETCRISLFDVIEKNQVLSADPIVLKSAFLLTQLGAWGGDAWHMKQAMGQRGIYLAMLKHSGLLESRAPIISNLNELSDVEMQWREWLKREHIHRLVYNWSMLDQELSLFHDTAPILSITEMQTPLPCAENLWKAENSNEWLECIQNIRTTEDNSEYHSSRYPQESVSLSHLFQDMLRDELESKGRRLSAIRLRLLLHPLQSLVSHLAQLLSCFYGMHDYQQSTRPLTTASTLMRLEEVQSSLQKWYNIAMANHLADPDCHVTNSSLVLYHLIYLNTVTYFPEIERLVRKEGFDGLSWETAIRSKQFIYQPEKAIFHCGQVFRLISNMPEVGRPAWWSAALYRVTMILWVDGISRVYSGDIMEKGQMFMINTILPDDLHAKAYLNNGYGIPALLRRDGSYIKLGVPENVLTHCICLLDEGVSMRFSDGIRRKLQTLLRNWKTS